MSAARKIPLQHISNRGYLPSTKVTGGIANYESKLERDLFLLLNHDPSVTQFQHQPETILWTDSKQKHHEYTPDVLVITNRGLHILLEVKVESEIRANLDKYRDSWFAANQHALQKGWEFRIITDKMIRSPRLHNVWFCIGASRVKYQKDDSEIEKMLHIVQGFPDGIEYKALCLEIARLFGIRVDQSSQLVCYAIYWGLLWVDSFSSIPISSDTLIRSITPATVVFPPLFQVIKPYAIQDVVTNGHYANGASTPTKIVERILPQVPLQYEKEVVQREQIVKEWLAVPSRRRTEEWRTKFEQRVGYSRRAIETWIERYRQEGIEGLIPHLSKRGRRKSTPEKVQEKMAEFLQMYLENKFSTIQGIFDLFVESCAADHLTAPSYSTFQRFVKTMPASELAKAKQGRGRWRQTYRPALDTFKDAIMPLQVVEIDNTSFDVFPVDETAREPLRTPFLIAAIDAYSRMVTGYYLTYDNPSRLTALEVLTMTILPKMQKVDWRGTSNAWPVEGLPVLVLVDNGMDYRAEDVKLFCMKYGIILEYAPVRTPEYKAYVEQWFEILKKGLRNENVPGFRPSLQQRKDMPEFDPEETARFTLIEIERWLVSWIVDTYHERTKQKGILPSPLMMVEDVMKGHTQLPLPSPVTLSDVEKNRIVYDSLNRIEAQLSNRGITKAYIQYNSPDLQVLYRREGAITVECRLDPRDIRQLFVIHPKTGKVLVARPSAGWARTLLDTFQDAPISKSEWTGILNHLRRKHRDRISPATLQRAAQERRWEIAQASKITAQVKKQSKQERIAREKKMEHARVSLPARLKKGAKVEVQVQDASLQETSPGVEEDHYIPKPFLTQTKTITENEYQPKAFPVSYWPDNRKKKDLKTDGEIEQEETKTK